MRALILAGGFATRLRPLTEKIPKSLLPIANRPFLEHQLGLLARHGVSDATLLTGYLADAFEPFVRSVARLGVALTVSTEEQPLDTAGAVRTQLDLLDGATLVFNSDVLTDLDLTAMVEQHRRTGAALTIALHHVQDARPYGLVPTDEQHRVQAFLEKQPVEQPGWINAGTYCIEPHLLEQIPPDTKWSFEYQLFPAALEAGEPVYGFRSESYWLDIGNPQRYLQANVDALDGALALSMDGQLMRGDMTLGDGTTINAPTLLSHAPVGAGAVLGPHCVLGPGCHVGAGAVVERSVLLPGARVGARAVVRGSILGPETPVADGAEAIEQVLA